MRSEKSVYFKPLNLNLPIPCKKTDSKIFLSLESVEKQMLFADTTFHVPLRAFIYSFTVTVVLVPIVLLLYLAALATNPINTYLLT